MEIVKGIVKLIVQGIENQVFSQLQACCNNLSGAICSLSDA